MASLESILLAKRLRFFLMEQRIFARFNAFGERRDDQFF